MHHPPMASRRTLLAGLGGLGLSGALSACATTPGVSPAIGGEAGFTTRRITPILMSPQRIIRMTVCTRPFRATGPRLDVERVGDAMVVHNYGHGGSGWSLSWGSSAIAARKAMAIAGEAGGGPPAVAVIGCGALGLTSALQLQRLGARVVIYARERPTLTRSMNATGSWTPDSRIADADRIGADFPALWAQMARESYATHQTYLGTDGDPVVFSDRYILSGGDLPRTERPPIRSAPGVAPVRFASLGRLEGVTPRSFPLTAGATPFPVAEARLGSEMQFNVTELVHRLETEFLLHGGRFETRAFHAPSELAALPEKIVINCTGYGARALFGDAELTPVRGQITWLTPQAGVDYGLHFRGVMVLSRPDGIVVQDTRDDMNGYGIEDETPDRAEAEATIGVVAPLFPAIRPPASG